MKCNPHLVYKMQLTLQAQDRLGNGQAGKRTCVRVEGQPSRTVKDIKLHKMSFGID